MVHLKPEKRDMRALSIRQPHVEAILRGIKTVEYRSRRTHILNERFYLYASKILHHENPYGEIVGEVERLPVGVIVGTAVIGECVEVGEREYHWYLKDVRRLKRPLVPDGQCQPQAVWWIPFQG